ncbi:MAG: aldehyde dehydrogenase family protein, partial [Nocardioides sp.]
MTLDRDTLFIDGGWATPATAQTIEVVSPHSEQVVATVPEGTPADIDAAVAAARNAFDHGPWPRMTPAERIDVIAAFSGLYAGKMAEMAEIITTEMGSPTTFANLAQSPAPWMQIEAFLGIAREFGWEEVRPGVLGSPVVVRREPVGVVAAIPPWNVPQFTIMSKVIPALLAGCTVVVKPAPETPLDGYLMAELLMEAGVPAGVVNIVAGGRETGEHLVAHTGIDKVAFTGSTAAGRKIAAVCGEQLKR